MVRSAGRCEVTARPRRWRRGLLALHSRHRAASHGELAIKPIYDQADAVAQFVGEPLVDHPTNDWRRRCLGIQDIASRVALLPLADSARLIALMMSPRSPSSRSVGSSRSETAQIPGSVSFASP